MEGGDIFQEANDYICIGTDGWKSRTYLIITTLFEDEISAGRLRVFHRLVNTLKKKNRTVYATEDVENFCFQCLFTSFKSNYNASVKLKVKEFISKTIKLLLDFSLTYN